MIKMSVESSSTYDVVRPESLDDVAIAPSPIHGMRGGGLLSSTTPTKRFSATDTPPTLVSEVRLPADEPGRSDTAYGHGAGEESYGTLEARLDWWLDVPVRRIVSLIERDRLKMRVIILCAETGMGKTHACLAVLSELERRGYSTRYLSLSDKTSSETADFLVRLARKGASAKEGATPSVVCLDDVPPADECDLGRQSRALKRLSARQCFVLMSLRPEAVQLAEELPQATLIQSGEMLVDGLEQDDIDLYELTRGVPSLVASYLLSDLKHSRRATLEALAPTLDVLVREHLRPTLPLEEQELRLAMMLLGEGTGAELSMLVDRLDAEALYWLQRDAPLLGVELASDRYSCACLSEDEGFDICLPMFRDAVQRLPEVAYRTARMLAARGNYHRSAQVASLLNVDYRCDVVREWGVEYVCSGKIPIVEKVVAPCGWQESDSPKELGVAYALALVQSPIRAMPQRLSTALSEDDQSLRGKVRRRHLELLRACRDLDSGMGLSDVATARQEDDELSRAFVEHLRARSLLLQGRIEEALKLLTNNPARLRPESLPNALLSDDYELAEVLAGESPREEECAAYLEGRRYLMEMGSERIACYRTALEALLSVFAAREARIEGIERAINYAERMGDEAIAAAFLLAGAIADSRAKMYPRAHVRASQAMARVSGRRDGLYAAARLMDALTFWALGEDEALRAIAADSQASVYRDLAVYFLPDSIIGSRRSPAVLARTSCSPDAAWALNMLCNDFGDASLEFRKRIPPAWYALTRRGVRKAQIFWRDAQARAHASPEVPGRAEHGGNIQQAQGPHIDVSILGGFSVYVNGKAVRATAFDKRRAKPFLIYLASARDHRASRYALVDSIWSENDYESGKQRIYEATSAVRNACGVMRGELDIFVSVRGEGTVGLNLAVVSVDVDRFERAARIALLPRQNDTEVISLACDAMDLYGGDLCETHFDSRGDIAERRRELANLYADVGVAGGLAALREGRPSMATRIARRANEVCPTREDVMIVLIEALKASGRYLEARDAYEGYSRLMIDQAGMPPSAQMRAAMRDVFPMLKMGEGRKGDSAVGPRALA